MYLRVIFSPWIFRLFKSSLRIYREMKLARINHIYITDDAALRSYFISGREAPTYVAVPIPMHQSAICQFGKKERQRPTPVQYTAPRSNA
jgi:hypothetical protein